MDEKRIDDAFKMLVKLDPIIQRHLEKLVHNHDMAFAICIITNIATSLLATSIVIHEDNGLDIDDYMKLVLLSLQEKYNQSKSQVETHNLLDRIMSSVPGSHQGDNPTKH